VQIRISTHSVLLLIAVLALASGSIARAQNNAPTSPQPRSEVAVTYTFVRSNAPVGDCGCFNLNGGSASFALGLGHSKYAVVVDGSVTHNGGIYSRDAGAPGSTLTMSTFMGGLRFRPQFGRGTFKPFAQVLAGGVHTSGTVFENQDSPTASAAGTAFAAEAGGGLDLKLKRHLALRLVEVDYLVTKFANGDNDHQNDLRINSGIVFRF
jgi:outer membrane immunogenic protein